MNTSIKNNLENYCAATKSGRCTCGHERGQGSVLHAVPRGTILTTTQSDAKALCGAKPGARSAGWSSTPRPIDQVTCPRCLNAIAKLTLEG